MNTCECNKVYYVYETVSRTRICTIDLLYRTRIIWIALQSCNK